MHFAYLLNCTDQATTTLQNYTEKMVDLDFGNSLLAPGERLNISLVKN